MCVKAGIFIGNLVLFNSRCLYYANTVAVDFLLPIILGWFFQLITSLVPPLELPLDLLKMLLHSNCYLSYTED